MRLLLALLSLLALTLAPLAAPAKAMTPPKQAHCADMAGMEHSATPGLIDDAKCCVALPVALPPADVAAPKPLAIGSTPVMAAADELTAIAFEAEDPPPRS